MPTDHLKVLVVAGARPNFMKIAPVIEFIREAAKDPQVVAIKQTVYRTGTDSVIMQTLIDAARAAVSPIASIRRSSIAHPPACDVGCHFYASGRARRDRPLSSSAASDWGSR